MSTTENELRDRQVRRVYDNATDRLERAIAINSILVTLGVPDASVEDIAKPMRWADSYAESGVDALLPLFAATRNAALEEAAVIAEGEFLTDNTGNPEDFAYDRAISDVARAIREAKEVTA